MMPQFKAVYKRQKLQIRQIRRTTVNFGFIKCIKHNQYRLRQCYVKLGHGFLNAVRKSLSEMTKGTFSVLHVLGWVIFIYYSLCTVSIMCELWYMSRVEIAYRCGHIYQVKVEHVCRQWVSILRILDHSQRNISQSQ